MNKSIGMLVLMAALVWFSPLHLANAYLGSSNFNIVTVQANENVGTIARKYTRDAAEASKLEEAIIEVNGLPDADYIQKGQQLKVPVLNDDEINMAESDEGIWQR
jgi:hypothetical protein